ncbi:unnamed protein product [Sphagnum troendelagicum]|uniref:Carbonic anhydrase n=1 Tax=Sphagnum troendelagicum TaxID=128251 RepID=A0ABP0V3H3_9BRYO
MPYQCMKMKSTFLLYSSSSSLLPALASAAITLRSNNRRRVVGYGRYWQTVRCGLETRVGVVTTTTGSSGGGGGERQRRAFVSRGAAAAGRSGNGGVTPPQQQQRFQGMGLWFKDGYELTDPSSVDKHHSQVEMTDTDAPVLHRLKDGFIRFKENKFLKESELFSKLAVAQEPKVMVIACCDSRVCPTLLMGLEPGEVFTMRNVANLIPPYELQGRYHGTSAALEFAVTVLQVEHIIVLGHKNCGGIRALMTRSDFSSDFIGSWMKIALPAKDHTLELLHNHPLEEQCSYCERESINVSLGNLLSFPWLEERFKQGSLELHGWYYDFVEGSMASWKVACSSAAGKIIKY